MRFFPPLKSNYNPKDSGLAFSFAFIAINLVLIAYTVFSQDMVVPFSKNLDYYITLGLIQLTILFTCILYSRYARVDFIRAMHISARPVKSYIIVTIIIGITMLYVFALPSIYFVELLKQLGYNPRQSGISINTFADFVMGTVFIAILPAVCEELLFRGIVLQGLRKFGDVFAIIFSSVLFMLMHANPSQTLYPFLSGVVLGFVFIKTGDLKYCIIIHFLNNFQSVAAEYLSGFTENAPYTGSMITLPDIIVSAVGLVIFAVCMVYLFKQKTKRYGTSDVVVYKSLMPLNANILYKAFTFEKFFGNVRNAVNMSEAQIFWNNEQQSSNNEQNEGDIYKSAVNLMQSGFVYNSAKDVFTLYNSDGLVSPPPEGFENISSNKKYHPFSEKKSAFALFSVTGVILCLITWIAVFFNL